MSKNIMFYDGMKAVRLDDLPDEAWTYVLGGDGSQEDVDKLFATVAWMYRAVTLRAQAVATMPFEIVPELGADPVYEFDGVTAKDAPPDKLTWVEDLPELLLQTEAASVLGGRAYWERRPNLLQSRTLGFAWLVPWSITPKYDKQKGDLSHFERERTEGKPKEMEPGEDVIYFWYPDYSVEIGPAKIYPGRAVMQNAGVIGSMDMFLQGYFDRGLVKATLLKYLNPLGKDDARAVKKWWKRVVTGVKNAFATEVVRGDFEAMTIGEGIADLRDNALTDKERESIATGLGVPNSMLISKPGGLGDNTTMDERWFYQWTVMPECAWIFRVINRQILHPAGFHIVAKPQTLSVMQEDEEQRAAAFRAYVGGPQDDGLPVETAIQVLGIAVPDGLPLSRKEVEKEEKEEQMENMPPEMQQQQQNPPPPPSPEQQEEAATLRRWIRNRQDQGRPIDLTNFESNVLRPWEKAMIALDLGVDTQETADGQDNPFTGGAWEGYP